MPSMLTVWSVPLLKITLALVTDFAKVTEYHSYPLNDFVVVTVFPGQAPTNGLPEASQAYTFTFDHDGFIRLTVMAAWI